MQTDLLYRRDKTFPCEHLFDASPVGLDENHKTVNTASVKTTFDLPDPLLRKAKAAAADQGRPLRDLVAEALKDKLSALGLAKSASRGRISEWKAFEARLQKQPDGSYLNPDIPEEDNFGEILQALRQERRVWQPRNPFEDVAAFEEDLAHPPAAPATRATSPKRKR